MSIIQKVRKIATNHFLRTGVVLGIDVLTSLCASAFVLVLISLLLPNHSFWSQDIVCWLLGACVASLVSFRIGKVYRAIIRYSTLRELGRLSMVCVGKEIMVCAVMLAFTTNMTVGSGLMWGMLFIDFFATLCSLTLVRVLMIVVYDRIRLIIKGEQNLRTVLVYGTGDKAVSTEARLRSSSDYQVAGFVMFGKELKGHRISGLPVHYFESPVQVAELSKKYCVDGILFPYVEDARVEQNRLIEYCKETSLKTYVIPDIDEVAESGTLGSYVRKVKIEDLLGRAEIKISLDEIVADLSGKVVMVTGAAGSIGSELVRQIATFGVKKLVLFDNAETPLHNIRLELEDSCPGLDFVPVIGDVRHNERLEYVFSRYSPQIVFHAAAYKHVPLMEENPCEAVLVNVIGSRQVADMCVRYGVEKMVMVSTDKAVNPTNIMGCTKRLAEIYVQSLGLAIEHGEVKGITRFVTTRFGNVLGSNGSVIPRFREQIEHGGPVTVTHPDITRFFMTIPEACNLVMEAATFSTGTQIFVFDMGESIKIAALAERMIHLAGLEVGRDIKIEYTGLRPGEKLYEEVLATRENTLPTCHQRIFVAKVREYPYLQAREVSCTLETLATNVNIPDMVRLMKKTVPEFKSRNSIYEKYDVGE